MLLDDDKWREQRNFAHVPTSKRYQKQRSKGYVPSPPHTPKKTGRFASGPSNREVLLLRPAGPVALVKCLSRIGHGKLGAVTWLQQILKKPCQPRPASRSSKALVARLSTQPLTELCRCSPSPAALVGRLLRVSTSCRLLRRFPSPTVSNANHVRVTRSGQVLPGGGPTLVFIGSRLM